MTIKTKTKKSRLRFVIIDVHSIWKAVWVPKKDDWILSLRYKGPWGEHLYLKLDTILVKKEIT